MGLAPFGPPRQVVDQPRRTRPGAAPGDRVRVAAGIARATIGVALVGAAAFAPDASNSDVVGFGLLVAFGWIPAAGIATALGRRHPGRVTDAAGVAVDIGLLVLVGAILQPSPAVLLAGLLAPVAGATYLAGRWLGFACGILGTAAAVVVGQTVDRPPDGFMLAVELLTVGAVVLLIDAVATDRWQANTGLLRLREKSSVILSGVGEAVVVTGADGRVEQWNPAATAAFGCDADAARRRQCRDVLALVHEVRALDCAGGCALLDLTEPDERGAVEVEVWRRSATGARQPLLVSASPVLDAAGDVVEVVHSLRDITRLKQADEAKTLFLATASHELKTPLTVIRGFAQMLLLPNTELAPEEHGAALRAIDVRAAQLTHIVDRLLMSGRIEAGRIELDAEPIDVVPILAERAAALEGATSREVVLDVAAHLPPPHGDADAFTTVLDHLLDNAVKYSPGGGPITVRLAALDDDVELLVTDQGVGMTDEEAAHCFDRFWQAEATDVRRFGGTGIGLYIVRSLVDGMGGRISVTSAPGAGSTFRLVLRRSDRRPDPVETVDAPGAVRGETTMIREYMRQLGVHVEASDPVPAAQAD